MKIIFLGTSHGVPEKDRYCSTALIEANGKTYLIDAGSPFVNQMIRMNLPPQELEAVFITHSHGDHMNGLCEFVDLASWHYKSKTQIFIPSQKTIDALVAWTRAMNGDGTRMPEMKTYEAGDVFDDGNISVRAYRTRHTGDSHCFVVEAEGKRVLFSGDMAAPDGDFPEECYEKKFDLIVNEAAHVDIMKAHEAFSRANTDRIILNHVAPYRYEQIKTLSEMERNYTLETSYDGMVAEL